VVLVEHLKENITMPDYRFTDPQVLARYTIACTCVDCPPGVVHDMPCLERPMGRLCDNHWAARLAAAGPANLVRLARSQSLPATDRTGRIFNR
jgi:hypothetical protein